MYNLNCNGCFQRDEISAGTRDGAVHVLRCLKVWYNLPTDVLFHAINLLDRFLTKMKVSILQLLDYMSLESLLKCAINCKLFEVCFSKTLGYIFISPIQLFNLIDLGQSPASLITSKQTFKCAKFVTEAIA